jgi:putative RNA 2'-phosphotransferase
MSDFEISKFLSFVLRHNPGHIDLELDSAGWANVKDLLDKSTNLDMTTLEHIVKTNNKKRFEFNSDKTKIRASQGHSVEVNLGYERKIPPDVLYHGTAQKNRESIQRDGLKKMNRHAVHLSADIETATSVGARHGKPLVYIVRAREMSDNGSKFYLSNNNVWLTENVLPEFLQEFTC